MKKKSEQAELKKLALQGDADACRKLGDYYEGLMLYKKAFRWYSESVKQENWRGELALAWGYLYGRGCDKDLAESLKWFKAAEKTCDDSRRLQWIKIHIDRLKLWRGVK